MKGSEREIAIITHLQTEAQEGLGNSLKFSTNIK
jgi:hypothetical protein